MWKSIVQAAFALLAALLSVEASPQNCFWSRIDHKVSHDASGAWDPDVYRGITRALAIAQIGGAIWEGSESRFGKTMWQGIDSYIISGVSAGVSKRIFTRVRPRDENNPCLWFQGGDNHSFPSYEAAVAAGLVTPYVMEYGSEYSATNMLLLLPLYVGVGRIKNQAHWQTDVVAGWAIGGLAGWYAHSPDTPILIELLPRGAAVGLKVKF